MMHISLPLDNVYLKLQEQKDGRKKIKKDAFATMKCVKKHYYFKVFSITLMYYIVINFLFKKIPSTCFKVDDLYCPWKF